MANFDVELNDEVENFTVEFGEIQRITVDDFDKLRNRPFYAGQTMTHETNIPEVPTAVSQLTNDADYQTGSEVESAISTAVGDEKDAREQADAGLSRDIGVVDGKVDAETDARERADTALQGAIGDEETARKNADNGLQGQIDAITSSSDVVDIVGTYAELLQYPTAGLGDKDVIKVLQDETHNDAMSYYRWNKSSSTWSYIGSEGPYYTKSETNTLLGDKQDTLTAGSNVTIQGNTISATDTTYTAGNGLTLTGTEFSADTTVLQPKLTAGDGINISAQNVISADIDPADFFTASETVDGTGSEMTLNNTIQAKIKSVQMDGDTYQQTYSGKNLLPYPYTGGDSETTRGITYTVNADGTVTLDGQNDGTANSAYFFVDRWGSMPMFKLSAGTYYFIPNSEDVEYEMYDGSHYYTLSSNNSFTVTFQSSVSIRQVYIVIRKTNQTQFNNYKLYPMLTTTANPTVADYEPYTGGIPAPNPDYPQDIQVVTGEQTVTIGDGDTSQSYPISLTGKNLWGGFPSDANFSLGHISWVNKADGTITANGTATDLSPSMYSSTAVSNNHTITLKAGTYTLSGGVSEDIRLELVKSDSTLLGASGATSKTITLIEETVVFVRGSIANGTTVSNIELKPQLELGPTATSYASYYNYELCKIGNYQDKIFNNDPNEDWYDPDLEDNAWYVHKETNKLIANSSQGWTYSEGTSPTNTRFGCDVSDAALEEYTASQPSIVMSNCFRGTNWYNLYRSLAGDNVVSLKENAHRMYVHMGSLTTIDAWNTFITNNTVLFRYVIATPTDTKITDATLISELDALADALGYKDKTIITVSATGTNLPAILEVSAYRNSLAGVLGVIGRAEAA